MVLWTGTKKRQERIFLLFVWTGTLDREVLVHCNGTLDRNADPCGAVAAFLPSGSVVRILAKNVVVCAHVLLLAGFCPN